MKHRTTLLLSALLILGACSSPTDEVEQEATAEAEVEMVKPVVYQVFTRLFGNQNTNNEPWGTIEQNGVGKFEDFSDDDKLLIFRAMPSDEDRGVVIEETAVARRDDILEIDPDAVRRAVQAMER